MNSFELGNSFEILTENFFLYLFHQLDIQVNNNWIQKAGYQYGFDVGFELAIMKNDIFRRGVFIECKNYEKSTLKQTQLHNKIMQFDRSDYEKRNSIFIFLSPKIDLSKCTQDSNPKHLEDYFNKKSEFKTVILTPNNRIKEILSLNENIFKKVYPNDSFIELDEHSRTKILEYFRNLMFSKGEIPDFSSFSKKADYLKEASIDDEDIVYVERSLKKNEFSFTEDKKTLLEQIKDEDTILLLGEPGSGKTTELINLIKYFQKNISALEITPIFINLSNLKHFEDINDILPSDWKKNNRVILLLDALDEFEFKNTLSYQITRLLENKDISIKIIISCRTYAYNDELSILKPTKFYLDGFDKFQSELYLNQRFKIPLKELKKIDENNFKDLLEDPFMLNLIGSYYLNYKIVPKSVFDVFTNIRNKIKEDEIEMYKTFAVILELTRRTTLGITELKSLFGLKYNKLTSLKFIQKSFDKKSFKFIHKNYQEYFAAVALSELPHEKIIDFIVIKGTNKIHKSLFNTVTFLINIVDINKYKFLVKWFLDNEPEILFKAEKSRIENFRFKLFQGYFETECIEKTLWISNNKTFTVKEIADFGNCPESFDYLVNIINNYENQYRVIISALELLCFFSIPQYSISEFKKDIIKLLKSELITDQIKSHALKCIKEQMLSEDQEYLFTIFKIFKNETSKEINVELLSLLMNYENIDEFFWFIKDEFLRDKRILQRKVKDEVIRGNSWKLEKLILKFVSSSNFIFFAKYYFDETSNTYNDNRFAEQIIERCLFFESKEPDFIVQLLSSFKEKERYYFRENLLKSLIQKSNLNSQKESFKYLIESFTFNNIGYFLASITNEYTIDIVIEKFKENSLDINNIDYFRNVIANNGNRNLAGYFNKVMLENGYTFKTLFLDDNEYEILKNTYELKPQKNFNKLFIKSELVSDIEAIFIDNGEVISQKKMREIEKKWYEKNGHNNKIDVAYSLLKSIFSGSKREITINDFFEDLKYEMIILKEIKSMLGRNDKIIVNAEQKQFLTHWCIKESVNVNFDQIMKYTNDTSFRLLPDYNKLKMILFFMTKLDIDLPLDFMLNSIEFFDIDKSDFEEDTLNQLRKRIKNDELFNDRIVNNLLNKSLVFFSLNKHIDYALKNNLIEAFPKIREYFFTDGLIYNTDQQLTDYFEKTNDLGLLLELVVDVKTHTCWSSLKILMRLEVEKQLCLDKAIEYIKLDIDDDKQYYYSNALGILFELNSLMALHYLQDFLQKNISPSLKEGSYSNYDAIKDYNVLEELFNQIYLGDRDKIGFSGVSNFLKIYICNLSKKAEGFKKTMAKLGDLKDKMIKSKNDNGLFYINYLINDCSSNYINSKSKVLNFDEALLKAEEIISW